MSTMAATGCMLMCLGYVFGLTAFGYGLGRNKARKRHGLRIMFIGMAIMALTWTATSIFLPPVVLAAMVMGNIPGAYCAWVAFNRTMLKRTPAATE